jgi:hypothetical protein
VIRPVRVFMSCVVILTAAGSVGCARVSARTAPADSCVVSADAPIVEGASATVLGNSATTKGYGFDREIAALRENGTIVYRKGDVSELEAAEVRDGRLVIKAGRTGTSEPISGGRVVLHTGGGDRSFNYSNACTVEQAGLGVYALMQSELEHGGS